MNRPLRRGVTVCVVTRDRPQQLDRLLEALARCSPPATMPWADTVIVDNDAQRTAEPSVDAARRTFPTPLRYVVEPTPGVTAARNTAIASSNTSHIAFIDDDMTPSTKWLLALTDGSTGFDADVAIGPVAIRFETDPPAGLAESGALDFPRWAHGETIDTIRTGNAIFARHVLAAEPFDHRLSASGGEDHMLGRQLASTGARIVYLDDAEADEWTPAERLTTQALTARQRRMGFAYAFVDLTLANSGNLSCRSRHAATALARLLLGTAQSLPFLPPSQRWNGHRLRWFAIGQLDALRGRSMRYYE